jgi:hypothetical protein
MSSRKVPGSERHVRRVALRTDGEGGHRRQRRDHAARADLQVEEPANANSSKDRPRAAELTPPSVAAAVAAGACHPVGRRSIRVGHQAAA